MVFSSNIFLFIFLPLTLLGYFIIRKNLRNIFLLIASLVFYAWGEPWIVLVMMASILINYLCGLWISAIKQSYSTRARIFTLVTTVALNLAPLFYYKYLNFFIATVNDFIGLSIPLGNIALPIGISFFTFQGMSYVLDLYMGKVEVQKNPVNIALYIALFPQLIAGPIVRYIDVNNQINKRSVNSDKFVHGIRRFAFGLAKKIVIANTMGYIADQIFTVPYRQNTLSVAWIGVISYAMQIYFDFSGYSDMAIGLGKMFGFEFLENFNYPYISRTITDFWRRWHISLSSWFRDYVYIPLGGNRHGNQYIHLLIVFILTGLWHGAAWNFLIWGLWHGAFLLLEKLLLKKGILQKIPYLVNWAVSMLIVLVGWVLFRAPDIHYALGYLGVMFGMVTPENVYFSTAWYLNAKLITLLIISCVACIPWRQVFVKTVCHMKGTLVGALCANACVVVLLLISIMLCMNSTYNPFIYFRF